MDNIAVTGSPSRVSEFRRRIPQSHIQYIRPESLGHVLDLSQFDLVLDLNLDEEPRHLHLYKEHPGLVVAGCAVKRSLAEMVSEIEDSMYCKLIGVNFLPTFIDRPAWEFSLYKEDDFQWVNRICDLLGIEGEVTEDRIGMVSPRVVFMIINEACFVLQEGTADIADVDKAMKLGTNYPRGPFEWADEVGLEHIFEVLSNMRTDTGDGRYKISPLLKQYYLKKKKFYPESS